MPNSKWSTEEKALADELLEKILFGVGDEKRERQFRMCVTVCRHRALSAGEKNGLPEWWHRAPALDIAGGPVEVLWSKGCNEGPSTQPCHNPMHELITGQPGIYFPEDCGQCPPCLARREVRGSCAIGTP